MPVHVPQLVMLRNTPQLSAVLVTGPHRRPRREHIWASVSGVQQVLAMALPTGRHSCPLAQPGHVTGFWQLSCTAPHLPLHVVVVAARVQPHRLGVTAPHC